MKRLPVILIAAKVITLGVCMTSFTRAAKELHRKDSDVGLSVRQLITKYGYPFENHTVLTEDGYVLEIHRIRHGRNYTSLEKKSAVIVNPSLLCSSEEWVNMGPERSLGFILADEGYDVWLANYRGTTWSRKHVTLNPDKNKKKFWNYSFHEIGYYDLPAFIDYILDVTGKENLYYIGHSLGSTTFFILTSEKSEYNKKIRLAIALSPTMYVGHTESLVVPLLAIWKEEFQAFVEKYHFYEILPHSLLITVLGRLFCDDDSPFQNICANIFYLAAGYSQQLNKTKIPVITSNIPAGSAFKTIQHFTQLVDSGLFRQYDYGEAENLIKYGQLTPPEYDLKKTTSPVAFYYGDKDVLCVAEDVERAADQLPNLVANELIKGFNHLDLVWGIDVVQLAYTKIIELMKHY